MKSDELYFNQERLQRDVLVRLHSLGKNQRQIKPVSRATLHRMNIGKPITLQTFMKLVEWLDQDVRRYMYYRKKPKKQIS